MGSKLTLKQGKATSVRITDPEDEDLSPVAANLLDRTRKRKQAQRRAALWRRWILLALLVALGLHFAGEIRATAEWILARTGLRPPLVFTAESVFGESVHLKPRLFPKEEGFLNALKYEKLYYRIWLHHRLDLSETDFLETEADMAYLIQERLDDVLAMPPAGEQIQCRHVDGSVLRGTVERLETDYVVLADGGDDIGRVAYRDLDAPSRLRLDAAFREHWKTQLARVYALSAYGLYLPSAAPETARNLMISARSGNREAQYVLGRKLAAGTEDERDLGAAFLHLVSAARQGHTDAAFALGKMYYVGNGLARDRREAMRWVAFAAQNGRAEAEQFLLQHVREKALYERALEAARVRTYLDRVDFQRQLEEAFPKPADNVLLVSRGIAPR